MEIEVRIIKSEGREKMINKDWKEGEIGRLKELDEGKRK